MPRVAPDPMNERGETLNSRFAKPENSWAMVGDGDSLAPFAAECGFMNRHPRTGEGLGVRPVLRNELRSISIEGCSEMRVAGQCS